MATAAMLVAPALQDSAYAQRRDIRAAAVPHRGGVVVGAYYRPLFFSPFYDPFYDPWFPYRYGWYPPYGYAQVYDQGASLRLQVSPHETEVFVDGYYAGTVDSFDGMFQRLHLEPGEHDATLYLAGYRTVTQKILLQPGATFRIRHTMEPLGPGETTEPRPVTAAAPRPVTTAAPRPVGPPSGQPSGAPPGGQSAAVFGSIAIRVQPADADVLIDGEQWEGPASDEALVIQVAPGAHRIEVRKDGYRSYTAQVDVRGGQTAPLNVSLPRQ
jgi:hypothetical protein